MRRYAFHPEARKELREALRFYEKEAAGKGAELAAEVRATVEALLGNPSSGSPFDAGTRRKLLVRFPYSIIYLVEAESIEVISVMHHRREPGRWAERV